jgi:hypothetical protein
VTRHRKTFQQYPKELKFVLATAQQCKWSQKVQVQVQVVLVQEVRQHNQPHGNRQHPQSNPNRLHQNILHTRLLIRTIADRNQNQEKTELHAQVQKLQCDPSLDEYR